MSQVNTETADKLLATYYYIGVLASPFALDCSVFGLTPEEAKALSKRFPTKTPLSVGINFGGSPFTIINALSELGYRVISSSGETTVMWTMQREI
ncbi:uncharacterized protein [Prorops nasuta]|uniref:uncharacterized protein isoform X3 n=1 Tax=Prorops nasuta TaxID=863751 RepID=UPI0034CD87C6